MTAHGSPPFQDAELFAAIRRELEQQIRRWVSDSGCEIASIQVTDMRDKNFIDPATGKPDPGPPGLHLWVDVELRDRLGAWFPLGYDVSASDARADLSAAISEADASMYVEFVEMQSSLAATRQRFRARQLGEPEGWPGTYAMPPGTGAVANYRATQTPGTAHKIEQ